MVQGKIVIGLDVHLENEKQKLNNEIRSMIDAKKRQMHSIDS